jgi:hypothetical protein
MTTSYSSFVHGSDQVTDQLSARSSSANDANAEWNVRYVPMLLKNAVELVV